MHIQSAISNACKFARRFLLLPISPYIKCSEIDCSCNVLHLFMFASAKTSRMGSNGSLYILRLTVRRSRQAGLAIIQILWLKTVFWFCRNYVFCDLFTWYHLVHFLSFHIISAWKSCYLWHVPWLDYLASFGVRNCANASIVVAVSSTWTMISACSHRECIAINFR